MKKLNLLKTIVDYVWIISLIFYPLIIIFLIFLMIDSNASDILPIKIFESEIQLKTILSKVALVIGITNFGLLLLALYNFKKLLNNFKEKLIFVTDTCLKLDKIGKLIIYFSLIDFSSEVIFRLSERLSIIEIEYESSIYLISLGLFFMVLSEAFKIGKNIKEENELTV